MPLTAVKRVYTPGEPAEGGLSGQLVLDGSGGIQELR